MQTKISCYTKDYIFVGEVKRRIRCSAMKDHGWLAAASFYPTVSPYGISLPPFVMKTPARLFHLVPQISPSRIQLLQA